MFESFYGLNQQPFGMTPDPKCIFWTRSHQEAVASLYYGIESGCGFMGLIAPPGMGKTTLLFHLIERLRDTARTAYVYQTQCNMRDFFRCMMADLGLDAREQDMVVLYATLYELLVAESKAGKKFVLIVDEAQNLDDSVLETVRLLSNFETPNRKLMSVILAGQPQLSAKLARAELWQLRQRISIISRIKPLTPPDVAEYIKHRLKVAGRGGAQPFTAEAVDLIASASNGIPRVINTLCFNALSLGFAQHQKKIKIATVREVISDLELEMSDGPATASNTQTEAHGSPSAPPVTQWHRRARFFRLATSLVVNHRYASISALAVFLLLAGSVSISMMVRKSAADRGGAVDAALLRPAVEATSNSPRSSYAPAGRTRLNQSEPDRFLTVIVGKDDNLDYISRTYLGKNLTPLVMEKILELNPQILDPKKLQVNDRIHLPLSESRITPFSPSLQQGANHERERGSLARTR